MCNKSIYAEESLQDKLTKNLMLRMQHLLIIKTSGLVCVLHTLGTGSISLISLGNFTDCIQHTIPYDDTTTTWTHQNASTIPSNTSTANQGAHYD